MGIMGGVKRGLTRMTSEMLSTLERKVDPKHTALLVVDVQNDFCAPGAAFDKAGINLSMVQEMVPRLVKIIDQARKAGVFVVFIRNHYNTENNWYLSETWLEHAKRRRRGLYWTIPMCVPGSWGADFYLVKPAEGEPIVTKHRYDAFENTDLQYVLSSRGIRTLIMTGFATNVCVETTSRHGFVKDYYIVMNKDCVASDMKELHEATLKNIENFFGEVVTSEDILKCWQLPQREVLRHSSSASRS